MVQLVDGDFRTPEVLGWKGVHVLHFMESSCSQKLRIFLNLKGIEWESHLVDLFTNENFTPRFLGINPRGLVPVLVHDGVVHIESNDIIQYLEKTFAAPKLIPAGYENEVATLLKHEDDLHLDLRTLSFRFVFAPPGPPKPAESLKSYALITAQARYGAARITIGTFRSSSGNAPPAKASPMRGPRRRNSAPSSRSSINGWRSIPI
ncbi:MAG: glutathione S-transferase N-terminal domain-containing protein [Xanthobacteraceae bacterium]